MTALRWLLDTNICIYGLSGRHPEVLQRIEQCPAESCGMSTITLGELRYGIAKSQRAADALARLEVFMQSVPAVPIQPAAASHCGELRALLERTGTPIGNNDLWIASHALAVAAVLVTNNTREFQRVPGLKVENWSR